MRTDCALGDTQRVSNCLIAAAGCRHLGDLDLARSQAIRPICDARLRLRDAALQLLQKSSKESSAHPYSAVVYDFEYGIQRFGLHVGVYIALRPGRQKCTTLIIVWVQTADDDIHPARFPSPFFAIQ